MVCFTLGMSKLDVDLSDWSSVVRRLGAVADLEATARAFGALQRVRKVRSASDLLRLAMMYGPGLLSLRDTAALAAGGEVVSLSDNGVLKRLRGMGDWLEFLLRRLLEDTRALGCGDGLQVSLVDGSVICTPGAPGAPGVPGGAWRLHARFDPGRGRFGDLTLTTGRVAERVDRTAVEAGQVMIQDRGYARVRDFQAVLDAGADFITRIGWRAVPLTDARGLAVDVVALLPAGADAVEHVVYAKTIRTPLRLVMQRLPPEKTDAQLRRLRRRASKQGNVLDARTLAAANHLILLTSLAPERQPAGNVLRMYRDRWQVELGFKRLKTLGGIDRLPALDPELARTWLLAHLIAAVLTDEIATGIVGFPPSGQHDYQPDQRHDHRHDHRHDQQAGGVAVAGLEVRPPPPPAGDPAPIATTRPPRRHPTPPRRGAKTATGQRNAASRELGSR